MRDEQKVDRSITIKVTEDERRFVDLQGNKSRYIRKLIQKDMRPSADIDIITKIVESVIASRNVPVSRDDVKNRFSQETISNTLKPAVEKVVDRLSEDKKKFDNITSAIGDMFDMGD